MPCFIFTPKQVRRVGRVTELTYSQSEGTIVSVRLFPELIPVAALVARDAQLGGSLNTNIFAELPGCNFRVAEDGRERETKP